MILNNFAFIIHGIPYKTHELFSLAFCNITNTEKCLLIINVR